jgi:hypothetical protein
MGLGLGDQEAALKIRDVILVWVRSEINRLRPRPRLGTVVDVSPDANQCRVQAFGDIDGDPIRITMGSGVQPVAAGQVVRFEGVPGSQWLVDVVSDRPRINANEVNSATVSMGGIGPAGFAAVPPGAFDGPEAYPQGTSIRLITTDDAGWPTVEGLVHTHQYDGVVRQMFYDKSTNKIYTRAFVDTDWLAWDTLSFVP